MPFTKIIIYFGLILFFVSCNSTDPASDENKNSGFAKKRPERTTVTDGKDIKLIVSAKVSILRAEPDPNAAEVARVREGAELDYLNLLTTFTTPMKIQGIDYDEPWLKAKTANGKEGWIYAGTISFKGISDKKLAEMVFDRRLYKLLGDELTAEIKSYQREMEEVRTLPAFRMLYRRGDELRKSMDKIVNEKLALSPKDSLPDFFWLNEAFPGFLVHLVNDNKNYRLFRNFAFWQTLAAATEADEDDRFVQVFLMAYQSDSIEFSHADWRLELEEEQYSLLGRGIHKEVLDAIEFAQEGNEDFSPELMQLKSKIIDDISFSKDFWESKSAALKELEQILKADYKILKKTERVEIASVKRKLQEPGKHGIRTGLFDGGEN